MHLLVLALLLALSVTVARGVEYPHLKFNTGSNAIAVSLAPSRTSGVAPLFVYFDATGTTVASATSKPFHDLQYSWNFADDAGGAVWGYGSGAGQNSKNAASGPVAGHVFESAGTYVVRLTVYDGSNAISATATITVIDPDAFYSGSNTICYTNGSDFAGCPAGASQIGSTADFSTVKSAIAQNKRVLLRRGDSFTTFLPNDSDSSGAINANGPWTLGAYGSGAKPIVNAGANNTYLLPQATTGTLSDWRLMDLDLRDNGFTTVACSRMIDGGAAVNNITFLRVDCTAKSTEGQGFNTWNQTGIAYVECTAAVYGYAHYSHGLTGSAVLGSSLMTVDRVDHNEHTYRLQRAVGLVISNSTLTGGQAGGHTIKLHAWGSSESDKSKYIVIGDNRFVGNTRVAWPVTIGPQNAWRDERVEDFIVERNWWESAGGTAQALTIWASKGTVRNNLFEMNLPANGVDSVGVRVAKRGIEPVPSDIRIYNNSFYSGKTSASDAFHAIQLATGGTGMVVKNNLAYAPNYTKAMLLSDSASGTVASNNSDSRQVRNTTPNYASTPPLKTADWRPTSGYAIGGGTSVPVWADFFVVSQPVTRDIGAVVH